MSELDKKTQYNIEYAKKTLNASLLTSKKKNMRKFKPLQLLPVNPSMDTSKKRLIQDYLEHTLNNLR